MNAFQVLGICADADIATIKKAYAKLLRQHRPDDDPAGFQRVHEAYQACVAHVQRAALRQQQQEQQQLERARRIQEADSRPAVADDNAAAPVSSPAATLQALSTATDAPAVVIVKRAHTPTPATSAVQGPAKPEPTAQLAQPSEQSSPAANAMQPTQRPPPRPPAKPIPGEASIGAPRTIQFRLADFAIALCEQDEAGQIVLQTWLQRCEPLYALGLKQAITAPLLQILAQRAKPLSPDGLRVVLAFFCLNTVSPERRTLEGLIQLLESRSRAAWSIRIRSEPTQPIANAARKKLPTQPGWLDKIVAQELVKPRNLFRRAGILLIPGFKLRMRRLLAEISPATDVSRDPTFNKGAMEFWRDALDPGRVSKWRILSMCTSVAVLMALLSFLSDGTAGPAGYAGIGALILFGWLAAATINASKRRAATKNRPPGWLDKLIARELRAPRDLYRRAVILLLPRFRGKMRRVIATMPPGAGPSPDPTIDKNALDFWRDALDPRHVSKWRIFSVCAYICTILLIVGVGSQDLALIAAYMVLGLITLGGWLGLAANDARKLRNSRPPGPAGSRTSSVNRGTTNSGSSWRWIIGAIIALNAFVHALTNK
jgi:hypothetical protein